MGANPKTNLGKIGDFMFLGSIGIYFDVLLLGVARIEVWGPFLDVMLCYFTLYGERCI